MKRTSLLAVTLTMILSVIVNVWAYEGKLLDNGSRQPSNTNTKSLEPAESGLETHAHGKSDTNMFDEEGASSVRRPLSDIRAYYIRTESFEDHSYAGLSTMKAIQGIVNREKPQLFIIGGSYAYSKTDEEWFRYYRDELGIQFAELKSIQQTVVTFKEYFKGIITFDTTVKSYNGWLSPLADTAVVLAGLTDTLPIYEKNAFYYSAATGLPILDEVELKLEDESKRVPGRLSSLGLSEANQIYDWQVDNLIEFANSSEYMALTAEGLDFAVQRKMLFIDARTKSDSESRALEAKVLDYFSRNNDLFYVWGWTENEYFGVHALSKAGACLRCVANGNMSFHAVVPATMPAYKQKTNVKPGQFEVDKDKFYISFMASEADTPKAAISFNHGGYLAEGRGSIAINWGMPANTVEDFPAVAEYYLKTATANDYFYTSGGHYGGYIDLPSVPEKAKDRLIEEARIWMKKADQPYLNYFAVLVFNEYHPIDRQAYVDYARNVGILGLIGRDMSNWTDAFDWNGVVAVDRHYSYPVRTQSKDKMETARGEFDCADGIIRGVKNSNLMASEQSYNYMALRVLLNFKNVAGVAALRGFISEDAASYYEVRVVDGSRIEVVRCVDGDETVLSTIETWIKSNTDYDLRLYLDGNRVQVAFGEKGKIRYVADMEDKSITSGRHGIYTTGGGLVFEKYSCAHQPGWKDVYDNIIRETIDSNRDGGVCTGFYGMIVEDDYETNQFRVETVAGEWILMTPTTIKMVMNELEKNYPSKFEAVTLDKFMAAASYFLEAKSKSEEE
ncbi:MAG: GxGYxYP family putative glycoside hydrolase [Limnochordia bacterium]|nr:GxGYxYP family putative glycoside hydrolase [Limnochordia bacterium]